MPDFDNRSERTPDKLLSGEQLRQASERGAVQRPGNQLMPGTIVEQRYKILAELGRGGMGRVYRVEQLYLHKEFALKTLSPELVSERSLMRFQKEAKAASSLDHPGLVAVHDFGVVSEQPYYVMDLIQGESLAERIKKEGRLQIDEALHIFIQIAFALGYAHEKGIVHRDLKPHNIMLEGPTNSPQHIKIVDFGIAKLLNEEENALTKTGEVFGSPLYMSPEQCLGVAVDHRSDIYSLGCVMFEALTGLPPFLSDSALSTMMKHRGEQASTLREASLGQDFPPDVEMVVAKLLQKDPDQRYQNLLSLARDLDKIKMGRNIEVSNKTLVRAKLERTSPSTVRLELVVAGAVLCLLFGYFAGRIQTHNGVQLSSSTEKNTPARLGAFEPAVKGPPVIVNSDETGSGLKYSKLIGKNTRVFTFPKVSIGKLQSDNNDTIFVLDNGERITHDKVEAKGTITVEHFAPLDLHITVQDVYTPQILGRFRSDELLDVRLPQVWIVEQGDKGRGNEIAEVILKRAGSLTSLQKIRLEHIGDKRIVKYLSQCPNLRVLLAEGSALTEDDILALKCLPHLTFLGIGEMHPVHKLLASPKMRESLRGLRAADCNLIDQDLANIALMNQLSFVDVSDNKGFTKDGLAALAKGKNLLQVNLQNCRQIRPEDLLPFKKNASVRALLCNSMGWSVPEAEKINKAMQPIMVDYRRTNSLLEDVAQDSHERSLKAKTAHSN